MHEDEKLFHSAVVLTLSKFINFCLALSIPLFLSRTLSIEEYGTYKLVMLTWMLSLQVTNMGMDLGLFYFVKSDKANYPLYSLNAFIFNSVMVITLIFTLNLFSQEVSGILNNDSLNLLMPYLSVLLLFSIPTQHLENYFISLDKLRWAVASELTTEASKSLVIISTIYMSGSLEFLIGALSLIYVLRTIFLLGFNVYKINENKINLKKMRYFMLDQISYGLPLGLARFLSAIVYFDKLIISFLFPIRTFTIYSVGCFEIPFVGTVLNTIWELSSIEMVTKKIKSSHDEIIHLWTNTIRKISMIVIPVVLFSIVYANEIIIFIFSEKYIESVPYFRLFSLSVLAYSYDCELLLRVYKDNLAYLKFQIINFVLTLFAMISLGRIYGPFGALLGKVTISIFITFLMLMRAKILLGIEARNLFIWDQLFSIILASVASIMALLIFTNEFNIVGTYKLLISGFLYSSILFFMFLKMRLISKVERSYIEEKVPLIRYLSMRMML